MPVLIDEVKQIFTLQTNLSTYQMAIGRYGYLLHTYYGRRVDSPTGAPNLTYLLQYGDKAMAPCPHESPNRNFSLDNLPQEYPSCGTGDFRSCCLQVMNADGSDACDLRYLSHRVYTGKDQLEGLPSLRPATDPAISPPETLEIRLADRGTGMEVLLSYSVFADTDTIARSAKILNRSGGTVYLEKALSASLDFSRCNLDLWSFWGRHMGERFLERTPVRHGKIRVDSLRGSSSPQQSPYLQLTDRDAGEDHGCCWGCTLVYSGSFLAETEVDQLEHTRFLMGIHPEGFRWQLESGESFQTPEAYFTFSPDGTAALSHRQHQVYFQYLCQSPWKNRQRPILINNWEGTYFDFTGEKIIAIAKDAAALGIEMLVMDDGWFGKRNNDCSGLGDWAPNEQKLGMSLAQLSAEIHSLGLKFGIWYEPEMISEDSDLYRAHPDWCLRIPGREPMRSRWQLVLDFSRPEIVDYIFEQMRQGLDHADYLKWDFNRHLTDVWSAALPPERQGEVRHRYVLGLYRLYDRITTCYPNLLIEGCASGGGRFDAGILYYSPQIWCSDNTDAIARLKIQYGTSFAWPAAAMGAHVSVCPNHGTDRTVPLKTRGVVAMSGTFGYELDITRMTSEEKEDVRNQIAFFKEHASLFQTGTYYRLQSPYDSRITAWMQVSTDQREALCSLVMTDYLCYGDTAILPLKGLDENALYTIQGLPGFQGPVSGSALMHAGIPAWHLHRDFDSLLLYLKQV